jgi:hypothetical protein
MGNAFFIEDCKKELGMEDFGSLDLDLEVCLREGLHF